MIYKISGPTERNTRKMMEEKKRHVLMSVPPSQQQQQSLVFCGINDALAIIVLSWQPDVKERFLGPLAN